MATTIDTEAYKAARDFIVAVDRIEDDRALLRRAIGQYGVTSENMLSAIARLHYELGQLMQAEREFRRFIPHLAHKIVNGRV